MTTGRELTMPDDVRVEHRGEAAGRLLADLWNELDHSIHTTSLRMVEAALPAIEAEARRAALDEAVEAVRDARAKPDPWDHLMTAEDTIQALLDATPEPVR